MKHTPGPWKLCFHLSSKENDSKCPCGFPGHIWGSDGDNVVCTIGPIIVPGEEALSPGRYKRETEIANAHLIAAAPDMLEALEAIEKSCPTDDDVTKEFYAAWKKLESAIRKAKGEG